MPFYRCLISTLSSFRTRAQARSLAVVIAGHNAEWVANLQAKGSRQRSRGALAPELCHVAPLPDAGRTPASGGGGAAGGARDLRDPFRRALRSARLHAHGLDPVTRGGRLRGVRAQ